MVRETWHKPSTRKKRTGAFQYTGAGTDVQGRSTETGLITVRKQKFWFPSAQTLGRIASDTINVDLVFWKGSHILCLI